MTDKSAPLSGAAQSANFLQEVGPALCAYCDFQDKDSAALLTHVMDKHREKITRPAAPVAVPAEPKCPSGPVKQCCDVCKRSRCECEISEDDYEYGEPLAKSITAAQKKLAEKLDAPPAPLPPPQEPTALAGVKELHLAKLMEAIAKIKLIVQETDDFRTLDAAPCAAMLKAPTLSASPTKPQEHEK